MPRKYVPRGTPRVSYRPEAMEKAINAVKTEGLTLKLASEVYGVPLSTLGKHYTNDTPLNIHGGRKPALSLQDEKDIEMK